jgi:prephenate dehydrogenase
LWQAIFLSNQPALLEALARFGAHLELFRDALLKGDGKRLRVLLDQGKYVRDSLSQP